MKEGMGRSKGAFIQNKYSRLFVHKHTKVESSLVRQGLLVCESSKKRQRVGQGFVLLRIGFVAWPALCKRKVVLRSGRRLACGKNTSELKFD